MSTDVLFNSYDKKAEGKIKGVLSIPRLQAEARSETVALWSPTKLLLQMDSSAMAYGSIISKRLTWRYGAYLLPVGALQEGCVPECSVESQWLRAGPGPLTLIHVCVFR